MPITKHLETQNEEKSIHSKTLSTTAQFFYVITSTQSKVYPYFNSFLDFQARANWRLVCKKTNNLVSNTSRTMNQLKDDHVKLFSTTNVSLNQLNSQIYHTRKKNQFGIVLSALGTASFLFACYRFFTMDSKSSNFTTPLISLAALLMHIMTIKILFDLKKEESSLGNQLKEIKKCHTLIESNETDLNHLLATQQNNSNELEEFKHPAKKM